MPLGTARCIGLPSMVIGAAAVVRKVPDFNRSVAGASSELCLLCSQGPMCVVVGMTTVYFFPPAGRQYHKHRRPKGARPLGHRPRLHPRRRLTGLRQWRPHRSPQAPLRQYMHCRPEGTHQLRPRPRLHPQRRHTRLRQSRHHRPPLAPHRQQMHGRPKRTHQCRHRP